MSDSGRSDTKAVSEPANGLPTAEAAAELKRIAARRQFLTRGTAGAGFVVLTLLHQRSDANGVPLNTHILSTAPNAGQAAANVACASFARATGQTGLQARLLPNNGASLAAHPLNQFPDVWYCFK